MTSGLDHVECRQQRYHDSVTLMLASRTVAETEGVDKALIAMATPLNVELAEGMGFVVPQAQPGQLLIAVRAAEQASIDAALAALAAALTTRAPAPGIGTVKQQWPATVGAALLEGAASLTVISVPGPYAAVEAFDAVSAGCSVMIFSDGVSIAQEIALKRAGREAGVLVMGPDCGTAIVNGLALGFANVVRRGPVGIVAASGTGAQQISALLETAGVGVSHLLGLGGRDLCAQVGGLGAELALAALDADPDTELIVLVSKPPDAVVAQHLSDLSAGMSTPVHLVFLGPGQHDLTHAVESVCESLAVAVPSWPIVGRAQHPAQPAVLHGYFVGGTLAAEALVLADQLEGVSTNLGSAGVPAATALASGSHVIVDFGADELTAGRAHPMIDPTQRLGQIQRWSQSGDGDRVLLLDVVLGYVAEPDPAEVLAPVLRAATDRCTDRGLRFSVVVSLCGTESDPQGWSKQAAALADAGARVFASNAQATRHALELALGQDFARTPA